MAARPAQPRRMTVCHGGGPPLRLRHPSGTAMGTKARPRPSGGGSRRSAAKPAGAMVPMPENGTPAGGSGVSRPVIAIAAGRRATAALTAAARPARSAQRGFRRPARQPDLRIRRRSPMRRPRAHRSGIRSASPPSLASGPAGGSRSRHPLPSAGASGRRRRPLPVKPGHAGTGTRGRRRNGTACLTAAPGAATGKAAVRTAGRRRPEEFLAFPGHAGSRRPPGGFQPDTVNPTQLTPYSRLHGNRPPTLLHRDGWLAEGAAWGRRLRADLPGARSGGTRRGSRAPPRPGRRFRSCPRRPACRCRRPGRRAG